MVDKQHLPIHFFDFFYLGMKADSEMGEGSQASRSRVEENHVERRIKVWHVVDPKGEMGKIPSTGRKVVLFGDPIKQVVVRIPTWLAARHLEQKLQTFDWPSTSGTNKMAPSPNGKKLCDKQREDLHVLHLRRERWLGSGKDSMLLASDVPKKISDVFPNKHGVVCQDGIRRR